MNHSRSPALTGMPAAYRHGIAAARPGRSLHEALNHGGQYRPPRPYQVTGFASRLSHPAPQLDDESMDADEPRVRRSRLEAVLLLAKSPLSARKLSQLALLADATEARTLVRQLNRIYDEFGRAIRIEQVAGGYRMLTRPALAPWLARLGHVPAPVRLSTPMMETLAVVAYRQPVSRANAEAVRGVACGELLRQLMERDLIRIVGRSEELGRPYLYGTTNRFLQLFGLPHADALPPIQWQRLQEDPHEEDSPLDDLSTSTKEPVVSISVAPVLTETDPALAGLVVAIAPPTDASLDPGPPRADIDEEDEEFFDDDDGDDDDDDDEKESDEAEEGDDQEDDQDWEEDDDWEDDDLDGDDDDVDEDDVDEDDEDDGDAWEEVDDEDADAEEEGDEEDESEEDDDDEDWDDDDDEVEDWDDDDEDDDDWD